MRSRKGHFRNLNCLLLIILLEKIKRYNSHGGTLTQLAYDASDRNIAITQGTTNVTYSRDVQNRIISRTLTNGTTTTNSYVFTGSEDSPDVLLDNAGNIVERYIKMPGGVLLTKRPTTGAFSLPNIHGDIFATTDSQTGTYQYDPFGQPIGSTTTNTATNSSYGWEGKHQKDTETSFTLTQSKWVLECIYQALVDSYP